MKATRVFKLKEYFKERERPFSGNIYGKQVLSEMITVLEEFLNDPSNATNYSKTGVSKK